MAANAPVHTVVISGYYGARNTGDNLILDALVGAIRTEAPDTRIVVAATNADEVRSAHGLEAFDRVDLATGYHTLAAASAFVLGGGGLWNDYDFNRHGGPIGLFRGAKASVAGWSQSLLLAHMFGARVHVYGMGVGPLTDPGAQVLVRFVSEHVDSIVVRDPDSAALLRSIDGWTMDVEIAPDPVYALPLPVDHAENDFAQGMAHGYVALNLRAWAFADDAYLDALRAALVDAHATHGTGVIGIPMQPKDEQVLRRFLGTLPAGLPTALLPWTHDARAALGTLAGARAVVAMRLHTCLLAHRLGRPVVALAYDPKVTAHLREVGRGDFALELTAPDGHIERALAAALSHPELGTATVSAIRELEQAAAAALSTLVRRIVAAPPREAPADLVHPFMPSTETAPAAASTPAAPSRLRRLFGGRR